MRMMRIPLRVEFRLPAKIRKRGTTLVLLALASALTTLLGFEVLLRACPAAWPHGVYGRPRFRADLNLTVHGDAVIYNRVRWVRRVPNDEGFLDVRHTEKKPPGVTRIGFFGDSHVEGCQVPLEETFFRRLPPEISGRVIEPLAFGMSGWGTLHALLAYRGMGPVYDLDEVIYFFYANDPGDQLDKVQRRAVPVATLADNAQGFTIELPKEPIGRWSVPRAWAEESAVTRMLRVQLSNVQLRFARPGPGALPDANDFRSTWPPALLGEAQTLAGRILRQFRNEVVADGRRFAVLYVPHGNEELRERLAVEDRWLPWLAKTCQSLNIELLDPTPFLREASQAGTAVYDDHWSPTGHALIASYLVEQHLKQALALR
jgi:hypothetical protein